MPEKTTLKKKKRRKLAKVRRHHGTAKDKKSRKDDVIVLYRHHLQELPIAILVVLLAFAAYPLSVYVPISIQHVSVLSLRIPIPLFGLMPLVGIAYIFNRLWNCRYEIHDGYVMAEEGRMSFTLSDIRIDYENVRGIEIDRSIYQRVMRLGDLKVGSSMSADVELVMHGILHPEQYREIIEDRIRKHFENLARNTMMQRVGGPHETDSSDD